MCLGSRKHLAARARLVPANQCWGSAPTPLKPRCAGEKPVLNCVQRERQILHITARRILLNVVAVSLPSTRRALAGNRIRPSRMPVRILRLLQASKSSTAPFRIQTQAALAEQPTAIAASCDIRLCIAGTQRAERNRIADGISVDVCVCVDASFQTDRVAACSAPTAGSYPSPAIVVTKRRLRIKILPRKPQVVRHSDAVTIRIFIAAVVPNGSLSHRHTIWLSPGRLSRRGAFRWSVCT